MFDLYMVNEVDLLYEIYFMCMVVNVGWFDGYVVYFCVLVDDDLSLSLLLFDVGCVLYWGFCILRMDCDDFVEGDVIEVMFMVECWLDVELWCWSYMKWVVVLGF